MSCQQTLPADELLAFPGAAGQGAAASGGRGGDVYHVTTLEDYRPKKEEKIAGSLRHAIRSAEAPRTIVFDVGGAIALVEPLEILKSDLTIAGQTAPKPGITLWGYPLEISRGSNIILRYLRVRLGDFHARARKSKKSHPYPGNGDLDPSSGNAMHIGGGCERVIVDHVSTCWGMDETLSTTQCRDVTVQHCIIASSLNDSFHSKGTHGYGTLIRGDLTPEDQAANRGGFTFYGNLWAHHRARNPSVGGQQKISDNQSEAERGRTDLNLVNNVVYNWHDSASHRSQQGDVRINLIGNCYINGPAKHSETIFKAGRPGATSLYQVGNAIDDDQDSQHDLQPIVNSEKFEKAFRNFAAQDDLIEGESAQPFMFVTGVVDHQTTASAAYQKVVGHAGCSLVRDAIDQAIIQSLIERTGRLIDSQEELRSDEGVLSGIDDLTTTRRAEGFDTDGDGMSDEFETAHQLDPNDPADSSQKTLSSLGYTNLDVYLNSLVDGGE